ncbi:hypothetical protein J7W08_12145 [Methanococcoides orientis]|nr:hypothetical protein J7W08_12145 [Methanococcoides orientis]
MSIFDRELAVNFIKKNKDYFSKDSMENGIKYFNP